MRFRALVICAALAGAALLRPQTFRAPRIPGPLAERALLVPAFLPNAGQSAPQVLYVARGRQLSWFAMRDAIVVNATDPRTRQGFAWRLAFAGANPAARVVAQDAGARVNFLIGDRAREWQTGLAAARALTYSQLWPGVDLTLTWTGEALEMRLEAAAGADLSPVAFRVEGTEPSTAADGGLVMPTPLGPFEWSAPRAATGRPGRFSVGRRIVNVVSAQPGRATSVSWSIHLHRR